MNKAKIKEVLSQLINDIIQDANGTPEDAQNFMNNVSQFIDSGSIFNKKQVKKVLSYQNSLDDGAALFTFIEQKDLESMIVDGDEDSTNVVEVQKLDKQEILHLFLLCGRYNDIQDTYVLLNDFNVRLLEENVNLYINFCEKNKIEYKYESFEKLRKEIGIKLGMYRNPEIKAIIDKLIDLDKQ